MATDRAPGKLPPVVEPGYTYASVTDKISAIVLGGRTPSSWFFGFAVAFALTMVLFFSIAYLLARGTGVLIAPRRRAVVESGCEIVVPVPSGQCQTCGLRCPQRSEQCERFCGS